MALTLYDRWDRPIAEYEIQGIGKCRLCSMTVGDEIEFGKLYPKPKNEYSPEDLARFTLRFVLRKAKEDKGPSLSEDEVKLISDELRNEIFEKLLDHSSYLYRESKSTTETDEKGTRVIKLSDGEVIHPRNDGETAIQYYQRVKFLYEQEQNKKYQEMFKKLNFSSGLNDQILKSMKNLDQIVNPFKNLDQILNPFKSSLSDAIRSQEQLTKVKVEPTSPIRDFDFRIPENPQIKLMKDLRDDLIENHEQSMVIFADISKTLIRMLDELQGSTKDTNKSLKIAFWSLLVTALIGVVQLGVDLSNHDVDALKVELHKSYQAQKEFLERITELEKQKNEQDKLILNELKKLNLQKNKH